MFRLVDVPNARSLHQHPTARGGGLGIVLASFAGWAFCSWAGLGLPSGVLQALLAGGGLIAVVSLVDDIRGTEAWMRLCVHISGAAAAIAWVGTISAVDTGAMLGVVSLRGVAVPLTGIWVVGLINAYNFMDGIDGLAVGQGIVASIGWMVIGFLLQSKAIVCVAGVLVAACAGFLPHNWNPARLFMGDVGSAFVGYSLAVVGIQGAVSTPLGIAAALLLLWPFLFDTGLTLLARAGRRENLTVAHRDHLYQHLTLAGWGHKRVCAVYLLLAVGCAALAVNLIVMGTSAVVPSILVAFAAMCVVWRTARAAARGGQVRV